ncbi:hypothetical protein JCM14076_15990 [Methylosoma difficile]
MTTNNTLSTGLARPDVPPVVDLAHQATRCPYCLNKPLRVTLDCEHCNGTGLFRAFKRPAPVEKLSRMIRQAGECQKCNITKTVETFYPASEPSNFVVRVFCKCHFTQTKVIYNPRKFYEQNYDKNHVGFLHPEDILNDILPNVKKQNSAASEVPVLVTQALCLMGETFTPKTHLFSC